MSPKLKTAAAASSKKSAASRSASVSAKKHYVLDTNVLLHDPTALFRFEENDIYLPMVVLEELDRHKKGVVDIARHARQVTRSLDTLLPHGSIEAGFSLAEVSKGVATGRLYFKSTDEAPDAPKLSKMLEGEKADNQILACALALLKKGDSVILVTKDINLRVKAMASGVPAQDFRSDRVFTDEDVLPKGYQVISNDYWEQHQPKAGEAFWRGSKNKQYARVSQYLAVNSFLVEGQESGKMRLWRVESNSDDGSVLVQESFRSKSDLLSARNTEQHMALSLLYDKDVDFVAMLGPAGTGKTLLAAAAGLEQVRDGHYENVLITRATVPMGDEIGFLPGSEQEKMDPWIGGTLRDVFSVLKIPEATSPKNDPTGGLRSKVEVASMSFMRGRSFQGKYIIIDEAQNLTIHQIRSLLTRAGEGSKVVLTGNLAQIDTPYLDEGSSGLAWAVKNLQNWPHAGHLILNRGERSRLASYVEEVANNANNKD